MKYEFPCIRHISDVLPHIEGRMEFIVARKDGYDVINYVVSTPETFATMNDIGDAIRRECRGMIFDGHTGMIISRPYHKFFNAGEKIETQPNLVAEKMQNVEYRLLHKMDGSMVRPFFVNDVLRWGTKMGITDTSLRAEEFIADNDKYNGFAYSMLDKEFTPIFEWISPEDRIVLSYNDTSMLVLTAVRDMFTGNYIQDLASVAEEFAIPYVGEYADNDIDLNAIEDLLSEDNSTEGVVIRFDDGHMVKLKTEWYVMLHNSKKIASHDRAVVRCILEENVDDLKSFLCEGDLIRVEELEKKVNLYLLETAIRLSEAVASVRDTITKKEFASTASDKFGFWTKVAFWIWDGGDPVSSVRRFLIPYLTSNIKYATIKNEITGEDNV
jgi:RNA ligase